MGAALLLVLLAPVLLGLAAAIRSSGSPVLERQTYVGHGGTPFTLVRFRSTSAGPASAPHGWASGVRRHGLDGLPQLLNVLTGSMSLVGPRPAHQDEVATYPPEIRAAHVVRPGLTGLWQSTGSTNLAPEESVRLDMRYVQHWSLTHDATIVWKSVKAAARPDGDY